MRKRLYGILEAGGSGDKLSNLYDIFMTIVINISLVPLCVKSDTRWAAIIDGVTVTIFIIDYVLRLATADFKYPKSGVLAFLRYPFSPMAIIDLLSILPSFVIFSNGLRMLKTLKLFRTLKILKTLRAFKSLKALKVARYSRTTGLIFDVIRSQKESLIAVAWLAVEYIMIAAVIVFNVEPDTFSTYLDAVYWACISLTTVGYGDIYPVTAAGKIITMLSSAVGIAIVALPSSIITAGYISALEKRADIDESTQDE